MANKHFTAEEREIISQMLFAHESKEKIAKRLGRNRSSIFREIKRNGQPGEYQAAAAQKRADARRKQRPKKMDEPQIRTYVQEHLQQYWSPDQIAGRLDREFHDEPKKRISRQSIYTWIRRDDHSRRWQQYLRLYRRRKSRHKTIPAKVAIANRPAIVSERSRYGDWEGDTIVGSRTGGAALVSLVERGSGYLELALVENRQAVTVNRAICTSLRNHPAHLRLTMTFDNGSEFSAYESLTQKLDLAVYFARPGCPWQRGTNENTNGLIRQLFPKGSSFHDTPTSEVSRAQKLLNERPRKRLGYQTPSEILAKYRSAAIET